MGKAKKTGAGAELRALASKVIVCADIWEMALVRKVLGMSALVLPERALVCTCAEEQALMRAVRAWRVGLDAAAKKGGRRG